MREIELFVYRVDDQKIITSKVKMIFENEEIIEDWMIDEIKEGNEGIFLREFNDVRSLELLIIEKLHRLEIDDILDILDRGIMKWTTFSKIFLKEVSKLTNLRDTVQSRRRDNIYSIINNKNLIVDITYFNIGSNVDNIPQEILLRLDYKGVPYLLDGQLGKGNIRLLKYKVYKFLYKMFPENESYWKKLQAYSLRLKTDKASFISKPDKNYSVQIDKFSNKLMDEEDKSMTEKVDLSHILLVLLTEIGEGTIFIGDYFSLSHYYNSNKKMIRSIRNRITDYYPLGYKVIQKIRAYRGIEEVYSD